MPKEKKKPKKGPLPTPPDEAHTEYSPEVVLASAYHLSSLAYEKMHQGEDDVAAAAWARVVEASCNLAAEGRLGPVPDTPKQRKHRVISNPRNEYKKALPFAVVWDDGDAEMGNWLLAETIFESTAQKIADALDGIREPMLTDNYQRASFNEGWRAALVACEALVRDVPGLGAKILALKPEERIEQPEAWCPTDDLRQVRNRVVIGGVILYPVIDIQRRWVSSDGREDWRSIDAENLG